MKSNKIQIKKALGDGWRLFKAKWKVLLVLALVTFVVQWVLNLASSWVGEMWYVAVPLALVSMLVSLFIGLRWIELMLKLVDGHEVEFGDFWRLSADDGRVLGRYLWGSVLFSLMVMVGMVLLVIPGVYLALMYGMFMFLLVDERLKVREALKKSKEITKGNRLRLLGFYVVIALLNVLGLLALGIGVLVAMPVTMLAAVFAYRQLNEKQGFGGDDKASLEMKEQGSFGYSQDKEEPVWGAKPTVNSAVGRDLGSQGVDGNIGQPRPLDSSGMI